MINFTILSFALFSVSGDITGQQVQDAAQKVLPIFNTYLGENRNNLQVQNFIRILKDIQMEQKQYVDLDQHIITKPALACALDAYVTRSTVFKAAKQKREDNVESWSKGNLLDDIKDIIVICLESEHDFQKICGDAVKPANQQVVVEQVKEKIEEKTVKSHNWFFVVGVLLYFAGRLVMFSLNVRWYSLEYARVYIIPGETISDSHIPFIIINVLMMITDFAALGYAIVYVCGGRFPGMSPPRFEEETGVKTVTLTKSSFTSRISVGAVIICSILSFLIYVWVTSSVQAWDPVSPLCSSGQEWNPDHSSCDMINKDSNVITGADGMIE
jgi:hypothetical protein